MRRFLALKIAVAGAFCAAVAGALAAPAPPRDLAALCARSPCRVMAKEFRLGDATGGTFILDTALVPYADEGRVTIFASETLLVALPPDAPAMPRFLRVAVSLEGGPPDALAFRLAQPPGRSDMVLDIQSTRDMPVAFDAMLYVPSPNGMGTRRITGCIAAANAMTRQTWPYPVATMVLSNFRAATDTQSDCR